MTLRIPQIAPDATTAAAMRELAAAGCYVGPISPANRKHPGSLLGNGWQTKTSQDPDTITRWFQGTDALGFIHAGRSGLCVFDVDHPAKMPRVLAEAIKRQLPPFQSSRPDQPRRGHYVFAQPADRMLGNSTGTLGAGWGEVRGKNGIIVVAPSLHQDAADGAAYRWVRTGRVPEMTEALAATLRDAGDTVDAATDGEIERFITEHTQALKPWLVNGVLTRFERRRDEGGSRHGAMIEASCWAARESLVGLYSAEAVFDVLTHAYVQAMAAPRQGSKRSLGPSSASAEAHGCIAWGIAQAEAEGEESIRERIKESNPLGDLDGGQEQPREPTSADPNFWETRDELKTIRAVARERMVSPWALLGTVLAHVVANTGPHVVLPPLVGGVGSLNLLIGLIGSSGVGKDSAMAVGRELLDPEEFPVPIPTHELGTGQGVAAAFVTENKATGGLPVQCADSALFTVTEIDDLAAHAAMGGANIIPVLRKLYSGSDLGNQYADKSKRRPVKAHRYRCALIAGIQPARSKVLLADSDGGLPQRWVWLPTNDPDYTPHEGVFTTFMAAGTLWEPCEAYRPVGEVAVPPAVHRKAQIVLEVCESAQAAVLAARRTRVTAPLTATAGAPDLDGHALFTRLKLAAALGILSRCDGHVTDDDWELAGRVMAVSDRTRAVCQDALGQVRRRENRAHGQDTAEREDAHESETVKRVARAVLRKLSGTAWVCGSDLRRGGRHANRGLFEPAIELLLAAGQIEREEIEGQGQTGTQYRRVVTT